MIIKRLAFISIIVISPLLISAQETARIFGRVTDERGRPQELVNVAVTGSTGGAVTNGKGNYELILPTSQQLSVAVSFVGFQTVIDTFYLSPGQEIEWNIRLKSTMAELPTYEVQDKSIRASNLQRINPKNADLVPSVSDGIPALLKTQPGVSSSNELSSQYSVRGGNFDENLVYVNDIEIYRPFLIRSGQQEGLSFVNSDLVSSILFSAGGYDAKYGDKMSSVLDIQYKKPNEFGGSASLSLLGGAFHVEGIMANRKVSYLLGVRHKTTQYLLNALDTKGDYRPSFIDIQGMVSYDISRKFELSLLGNYASNKYKLVPESRETDFGTYQQARRLKIFFDGQEVDRYLTYLGGATLTFKPTQRTRLRLITSGYNSIESETYDMVGQYFIGRVENNFASENFGDVVESQGVGTFMEHARNKLNARVFNVGHKGTAEIGNQLLQWGVKWQMENIDDQMSEWIMIDSAGYSIPHPPDSIGYTDPSVQLTIPFELYERLYTDATIKSNRYTAYVQNTWGADPDSSKLTFTFGVRANYWDYNNQLVVSPRATLSFKPEWKRDILFRFSAGYYYQPPFYRELKDLTGNISNNVKAQKSIHLVAASDWNFTAWDRPFKFITEVYYKHLDQLVPYLVDNVRVRYYGENNANGYATGIDFKVNGEFVRGIESWASLSIMSTKEDIKDDFYYDKAGNRVEPGYIPRPTDQLVNFSLFFQDYLPSNPTYKMSLTLIFGSGLPFGPPQSPKYTHTLRMPPYRRVDIGFSKELIGEHTSFAPKSVFRGFKSVWVTLEVLNLLQINNTVSYIWVTDIYGRQYAVPNFLTPRQLNLRLIAKF